MKRQRSNSNAAAAATQQQRQRSTSQKKAKLESQRQSKLDENYYKEYAANVQKLKKAGITREQQYELERGMQDPAIVTMQREKLASILALRNVSIAPKSLSR